MATKLEKAQAEYEKLLIELGKKAEMVEMLDRADPTLLDAFQKARDSLADRRLELEFIQGEIDGSRQDREQNIQRLEGEIADLKESIKKYEKTIGVKKDKAGPLKTKLAGGEYDLKFVEKALREEQRNKQKAEEKEDFDKAARCEEKIKAMKIDILKRKGQLDQLRTEIGKFENPADKARGAMEAAEAQVAEKEAELAELQREDGGELQKDLERQKEEKQKDVRRSELHLVDTIADLGENLYEKRVAHPVLDKYYTDIDGVAQVIDRLQGVT